MDRRPRHPLRPRAVFRAHQAGSHHPVECLAQQLEWIQAAGAMRRLVAVGRLVHIKRPGGKRRAEQARLPTRKAQITQADAAKHGAGALARIVRGSHRLDLGFDGVRQLRQSCRPHRFEQGLVILEMAVRRVRHHAGAARDFAQHHGLRPAFARQRNAGAHERGAQIAVSISAAGSG
ncbi:hypothetical protein CDEF62S_05139 [Castellaniella defragrans]